MIVLVITTMMACMPMMKIMWMMTIKIVGDLLLLYEKMTGRMMLTS